MLKHLDEERKSIKNINLQYRKAFDSSLEWLSDQPQCNVTLILDEPRLSFVKRLASRIAAVWNRIDSWNEKTRLRESFKQLSTVLSRRPHHITKSKCCSNSHGATSNGVWFPLWLSGELRSRHVRRVQTFRVRFDFILLRTKINSNFCFDSVVWLCSRTPSREWHSCGSNSIETLTRNWAWSTQVNFVS